MLFEQTVQKLYAMILQKPSIKSLITGNMKETKHIRLNPSTDPCEPGDICGNNIIGTVRLQNTTNFPHVYMFHDKILSVI